MDRLIAKAANSPVLRGNNLAVQTNTDPEVLLVGAAGTGKTFAVLKKIHDLMSAHKGARALIVRKVRADLAQSVLVTLERDVLGFDNPICAGVQRESRQVYQYPNGSQIVVGGMDRPGRILSAEYDFIYAAEAVQFSEEDWETLVMRNRSNILPYRQVVGDTNPDRPDHWLKQRADAGMITLLNTFHRDNPAFWDNGLNDWTARGRDYVLGKLERLTGVRRLRYLEGKWVIAEGAVYEDWDEKIHWIDPFPIPPAWTRFRAVDFGYTNPFVCQWWAVDPDGRMYLYRELYATGKLVEDHAADIRTFSAGERITYTTADHDAEDRATLKRHGVDTLPAQKSILDGIQAVQERLRKAGDGKPRLFVLKDALVQADPSLLDSKKPVSTASEFPGYVWAKTTDGKANKELPQDLDNHGMDAMRYAVMSQTRKRREAKSFQG